VAKERREINLALKRQIIFPNKMLAMYPMIGREQEVVLATAKHALKFYNLVILPEFTWRYESTRD
jgi:hypothetical protein